MSTILFPLICLFSFNEEQSKARIRKLIQLNFKLFFAIMHYGGLVRFEIRGFEKLKDDRGTIVVANHPSLIDVVALISMLPRANCIVKKALFANPFLKGVVKGAGYVPNDESENVLAYCKESLDKGDNLVIFPEGTRSVPGQPLDLKRGAAQIAFRLQAPIRIVKITVDPPTLMKGAPWYSIPPKRSHFLVEVLHLVSTTALAEQGLKPPIAARRLTAEIRQNIEPPMSL